MALSLADLEDKNYPINESFDNIAREIKTTTYVTVVFADIPNAIQVNHQNKDVKQIRFADEIEKPLTTKKQKNRTNSGATAQIAIDEPTPDYCFRHGGETCSANNNNKIIDASSSQSSKKKKRDSTKMKRDSKKKKRGSNINGETCSANNVNDAGAGAGSSKSSNNAGSPAISFRKRSKKGNPRRSSFF